MDPFSGSGTTLVEAQRLGRRAIGFELNPVAVLASRAKLLTQDAAQVEELTTEIVGLATKALTQVPLLDPSERNGSPPPDVQIDKWYTPAVAAQLTTLWSEIADLTGGAGLIAHASFSAILLDVCREERHWGYVCDNTQPKGNRDHDVLAAFTAKLMGFAEAYAERDEFIRRGKTAGALPAIITEGDSREALKQQGTDTVDLVVTSPPYFGVSDYVKAQRLTLEWLGIPLEPLREAEIGARSKRRRISARSEFIHEVMQVFGQVHRVLRRRSICALVLGESTARAGVLEDLLAALQHLGFQLLLDLDRRVSMQRRQHPSLMDERLVILSKK